MDNAIRERAMPRHQIWYSNGRYVFCSRCCEPVPRSGPIRDPPRDQHLHSTIAFLLHFVPSFFPSFAYPLFLLLLRTISTCRIFVRKELEIFQRFVFESRVKRERERERERMIVDGRSPSNGDPPRGIYKVRARSYLKVRYAIGDISMPNISHKAAPRSPCHIKYYLCPFV